MIAMHKFLFCFFFLFFITTFVGAQNRIQFWVVDELDKPLPGAHVFVNQFVLLSNDSGFVSFDRFSDTLHIKVQYLGYRPYDFVLKANEFPPKWLKLKAEANALKVLEVESHRDVLHMSMAHEVADKRFLEENNDGTLVNTLSRLPGVQAISLGVGIAKPVIRGLSFNRVLFANQGIKQDGQQWGADHGIEIDQFDVEEVDVIKGPATLLYGSDAMGGIINVLPGEIPKKNGVKSRVDALYKSNNNHYGVSAQVQGRKGAFFGKLRLTGVSFGDYRVPADSFVYNRFKLPIFDQHLENTAGKEQNLSAELGVVKANFTTRLQWSTYHLDAGIFPGAMGIPRSYNLLHDGNRRNIALPRQNVQHHRFAVLHNHYMTKRTLHVEAAYQVNLRTEESLPHTHGISQAVNTTEAMHLRLQSFIIQARIEEDISDKIELVYGVSGSHQTNEVSGFEFLIPNYTQNNGAIYAILSHSLSEKWQISGGTRFDHHLMNIERGADLSFNQQNNYQAFDAVNTTFSNFSASLGLAYQLKRGHVFRYQLARSFRVPNIAELAGNGVHHGTFRHEMGSPTMKSEIGYQQDISYTFTNNRLHLSSAAYFNYFQDFIYLRPSAFFSPLPDGGQLFSYQQHNALHTGFEFFAKYRLAKVLSISNATEYTYAHNLVLDLPLPFIPPFSSLTDLRFDFKRDNKSFNAYHIGGSCQYVAAQNRVDLNERETPSYTVFRVFGGVILNYRNQEYRLFAEVQNLFNQSYMMHLSRYRLLNLPEQGRNIVFRLSVPIG